MTNHPNPNSAAQAATNNTAQNVLTDDEINTACDWPAANTTMRAENDRAMAREVEAAVLRKLRAPVAGERCKRCGGPGWYTSHTTGYPESIPCSACNPQGFSVERLERDPFLAAQLWRKPVDFADAYKGAREDLAIWKRRALEAERDLRAERETSSRLVATLNAENGATHMGEPTPQASADDVRSAALEEAATVAENSYADAHIRIRALKTQAGKDGGQQRAEVTGAQCFAVYQALDEFGRDIDIYEYGLPYLGDDHRQQKVVEIIRAALSAPQAEQGEREDG